MKRLFIFCLFSISAFVFSQSKADISFTCDPYAGFFLGHDNTETVGHVNSMKIGEHEFSIDLSVKDPTDFSDISVMGVMYDIYWSGGYTEPVYISFLVSNPNRGYVGTLLHTYIENTNVDFTFSVYSYDPVSKKYYSSFRNLTGNLLGMINKTGGELALAIGDTPDPSIPSPEVYLMTIGIAPRAITQYLEYSSSPSSHIARQWGQDPPPPPSAPVLISPSDNAYLSDLTPTFDWSDVSDATSYSIQADNNSDFSSPEISQSSTASTYTPGTDMAEGTYYWRVKAVNSYGSSSYTSSRILHLGSPPHTPTLKLPTSGSSTDDATPLFNWYGVAEATGYDMLVDNNSDFSSPELDLSPPESYHIPTADMQNGTYYWKVRAKNLYGISSWSATWSLTIEAVPSAPVLIYPVDSVLVEIPDPVFEWSNVTNTTTYHIEIDTDPAFPDPITASTDSCSIHMYAGNDDTYYWRVRGQNEFGYGDYSETGVFYIIVMSIAIIPPDILSIQTNGNDIVITIAPVYGATEYYVYRSEDPYGTFNFIGSFTSDTYTDTDILLSENKYFYRIVSHFWDK